MLEKFEGLYQAAGCLRIQSHVEGVANFDPGGCAAWTTNRFYISRNYWITLYQYCLRSLTPECKGCFEQNNAGTQPIRCCADNQQRKSRSRIILRISDIDHPPKTHTVPSLGLGLSP